MIRSLLAAAAVVLLGLHPTSADAQGSVFCINCDTSVQAEKSFGEQILQYGKQLEQLAQEGQTAQNTLNYYLNAVAMAEHLPQTFYRDATGDIAGLASLANLGSLTQSGPSGALLTVLGSGQRYPIYSTPGYINALAFDAVAVSNIFDKAARIFDQQPRQLQTYSTNLNNIQDQAAGITSRTGLLQSAVSTTASTGQMIATGQVAQVAALQGVLAVEAARQNVELYNAMVTGAQERAGIRAACTAAASTGITTPIQACTFVPRPPGGTGTPGGQVYTTAAAAPADTLATTINDAPVTDGTTVETTTPIDATTLN